MYWHQAAKMLIKAGHDEAKVHMPHHPYLLLEMTGCVGERGDALAAVNTLPVSHTGRVCKYPKQMLANRIEVSTFKCGYVNVQVLLLN